MTMVFRKAILADILNLKTINQELQEGNNEEGFLRQTLNFEEILLSSHFQVYIAEADLEILGYIVVAASFPSERLNYLRNSKYPLIDLTNSTKYHFIKQLAVQRKYQRQGVGTFLYSSLFSIFPIHLFLGIVLKENHASLNFQLNQGAQVVAEYWKDEKLTGLLLVKGHSLLPSTDIIEDIAM